MASVTQATETRQMEQAIAALLAGGTPRAAADAADLTLDVLRRRLKTPRWRAALSEAEAEALLRTRRGLLSSSATAVRVLLEASTNPTVPWSVRVQAASRLLGYALGPEGEQTADLGEAEVLAAAESLDTKIALVRTRFLEASSSDATEAPVVPPAEQAPAVVARRASRPSSDTWDDSPIDLDGPPRGAGLARIHAVS